MANTQLTKKDKSLIYFCVLLAISAIAYIFGISPLIDEKDKLEKKLLSKTSAADEATSNRLMYDIIKTSSEDSEDAYSLAKRGYSKIRFTTEADEYLTRGMQECGLKPLAMTFDMETDVDSEEELETDLVPYNFILEKSSDDNELTPITIVAELTITMNCSGSMVSINNFVDKLNTTEGLYVSSVSISPAALLDAQGLPIDTAVNIAKGNPQASAEISVVYYIYFNEIYEQRLLDSLGGSSQSADEEDNSETNDETDEADDTDEAAEE